ncbi:MAG: hypothetical protein QFC78_10740 [Pseudomonadota bacterium]|nr:hypothetical protein [Pseudomonadota bacterium]
MRRSLVLTDEMARHPFLASLAPHIRRSDAPVAEAKPRPRWMQDLREFLMAYCACFIAVSLYIA